MWLEYIRYRFRLDKSLDLLEVAQIAALEALRNSPHCQSWRVVPAADDPSHLLLEIEWDPGEEVAPFRGSEEFELLHSALASHARSLEEADYNVDSRLLRRVLGEPETLFRLAEDIVDGVMQEPVLAWRFRSDDGSTRGRLGLWLLQVLGGPDMFSSSFPGSTPREGPLATDRLDLEERERLLEIASDALPSMREDQYRCVIGNLRAHLPVHPALPAWGLPAAGLGSSSLASSSLPAPSLRSPSLLSPSPPSVTPPPPTLALPSGSRPSAPASTPTLARQPELERPAAPARGTRSARAAEAPPSASDRAPATGVRSRLGFETPEPDSPDVQVSEAEAVGHPWSARSRPPSPSLRSRRSGRWPRWREPPR